MGPCFQGLGAPPFGPTLRGLMFLGSNPQERNRKSENGRERVKKSAKFWAPRLRAPTLRAPTLRGPTLWAPTLRAEAPRLSTFSGFGPLRSSFLSCCSFVPFLCIFNCFYFLSCLIFFFKKKNSFFVGFFFKKKTLFFTFFIFFKLGRRE